MIFLLHLLTCGLLLLTVASAAPIDIHVEDGHAKAEETSGKPHNDKFPKLCKSIDNISKEITEHQRILNIEELSLRAAIKNLQEEKSVWHEPCPPLPHGMPFPMNIDPHKLDLDQIDFLYTHTKQKDRKKDGELLMELLAQSQQKHARRDLSVHVEQLDDLDLGMLTNEKRKDPRQAALKQKKGFETEAKGTQGQNQENHGLEGRDRVVPNDLWIWWRLIQSVLS